VDWAWEAITVSAMQEGGRKNHCIRHIHNNCIRHIHNHCIRHSHYIRHIHNHDEGQWIRDNENNCWSCSGLGYFRMRSDLLRWCCLPLCCGLLETSSGSIPKATHYRRKRAPDGCCQCGRFQCGSARGRALKAANHFKSIWTN